MHLWASRKKFRSAWSFVAGKESWDPFPPPKSVWKDLLYKASQRPSLDYRVLNLFKRSINPSRLQKDFEAHTQNSRSTCNICPLIWFDSSILAPFRFQQTFCGLFPPPLGNLPDFLPFAISLRKHWRANAALFLDFFRYLPPCNPSRALPNLSQTNTW